MSETVFTRIIKGEIPSAKVYEDDQVFAFMDAGQVNPGHVLVALKRPAETILGMTEEEMPALFRAVHRIAKAIEAAFQPQGITILQANRPAGWQTVPHVHVHVLPRYENDGVTVTWPRKNPPLEELRALAAKLTL